MADRYIKLDDAVGILSEQVFYKENDKVAREGAECLLRDVPTIEASEDCISREWLRKQAFDIDDGQLVVDIGDIDNAPSVVPDRPSEDCISRMETIEVLGAIFENMNLSLFGLGGKDLARKMLQNLEVE